MRSITGPREHHDEVELTYIPQSFFLQSGLTPPHISFCVEKHYDVLYVEVFLKMRIRGLEDSRLPRHM